MHGPNQASRLHFFKATEWYTSLVTLLLIKKRCHFERTVEEFVCRQVRRNLLRPVFNRVNLYIV